MNTYLYEYEWDGSKYMLEIPAENEWEAESRLLQMRSAKFVGELVCKVPSGFVARWLCRVRNFFAESRP